MSEVSEMSDARLREVAVTLCYQDIVEYAYLVRETVEPLAERHNKLFFEQANCYLASFYKAKRYLALIEDEGYRKRHAGLFPFFEQELSNNWDRLRFETETRPNRLGDGPIRPKLQAIDAELGHAEG